MDIELYKAEIKNFLIKLQNIVQTLIAETEKPPKKISLLNRIFRKSENKKMDDKKLDSGKSEKNKEFASGAKTVAGINPELASSQMSESSEALQLPESLGVEASKDSSDSVFKNPLDHIDAINKNLEQPALLQQVPAYNFQDDTKQRDWFEDHNAENENTLLNLSDDKNNHSANNASDFTNNNTLSRCAVVQ